MATKASSGGIQATPPLRLETIKAYAEELFAPIRRGESVATIWVPMAGRRIRNKFIISYPELFEKEIGDISKYLLVYVEPLELTEESNPGYIKLIIKSIADTYRNKVKNGPRQLKEVAFGEAASYPELLEKLDRLVQEITSQGLEIVLFLGEFDELEFASSVLYNNLKALWVRVRGKLHFIFLLLADITRPELIKEYGELNELLLKNVVYVPLVGTEDINYLLSYFSKQLNRDFSQEEQDLLVKICGGHPYLLRSCSRLIALMNGKKLSVAELERTLISHFEPRSVCQKIFDLLTSDERDILRKVTADPTGELPSGANTLLKLGLVRQNKDAVWEPFGGIFRSVIEQNGKASEETTVHATGDLSFDEKTGAIFVAGASVEEKFTRQEYEILRFLLAESDKLRSREEIGEAMWGKESYDKYSDWAIDQVMSKIRKKLKTLGAENALATVRGRGYKLVLPH